jgi:hypothetical protein
MAFDWALPFHEPGLAPVGDGTGAYHIHLDGSPAYEQRFERTFGFYGGLAAVVLDGKWFHIKPDGKRAYTESWDWCGNFQQNRCTVRNSDGHYHHIRQDGSMNNGGPHSYAGDFREDSAVVRGMDGMCCHVDKEGAPVHDSKFLDLDVFHKGFARARDEGGWHHIDREGNDVSDGRRYAVIEPFYNGQALARSLTGEYLVIDESGLSRAAPVRPDQDIEHVLQKIAISSWRPIAVRLGILAGLAGGENRLTVAASDLQVLESAWIELGLRSKTGEMTEIGRMLAPAGLWEDRFLYWTGLQFDAWTEAEERLKHPGLREDFFARHAGEANASDLIQRVLHSYAENDWKGISDTLRLSPAETVVDLGGGRGALLEEIAQSVSARILIDRPEVVEKLELDGIQVQPLDIFMDEIPAGDVYLLSRVLHDWDDAKCIHLLKRIPRPSRVIVIDRTAEPGRHGLLSLNMLLVSGGRERTNPEWRHLFSNAGWAVGDVTTWSEHSVFSLVPRSDESWM